MLESTPEARGRLLIDLINEPDGYSLTWEVSPDSAMTPASPCAMCMTRYPYTLNRHSEGTAGSRLLQVHAGR